MWLNVFNHFNQLYLRKKQLTFPCITKNTFDNNIKNTNKCLVVLNSAYPLTVLYNSSLPKSLDSILHLHYTHSPFSQVPSIASYWTPISTINIKQTFWDFFLLLSLIPVTSCQPPIFSFLYQRSFIVLGPSLLISAPSTGYSWHCLPNRFDRIWYDKTRLLCLNLCF